MSNTAIDRVDRRQFSLRGLFFVTTVACLCAASVQASPLLAIALIPLAAAALVGTFRAMRGGAAEAEHASRRGLFATFCHSLAIVLSLIVVSLSLTAAAAVAGALFVLGGLARAASPLVPLLRNVVRLMRRVAVGIWQRIQPTIAQFNLRSTIDWARAISVAATARLARTGRHLLRTYWDRPLSSRTDGTMHEQLRGAPSLGV